MRTTLDIDSDVLAAAKKALRLGTTSSLQEAIATEKSLSREIRNVPPETP